eukprot:6193952-Pleurochrysis_carterae.AAC.1
MQMSGTEGNIEMYVTCFQHFPPVRQCGQKEEHMHVARTVASVTTTFYTEHAHVVMGAATYLAGRRV